MRLVGRTIQQQGDRAGEHIAVPGAEDDPLVAAGRRQRAVPEGIGGLRLQRMHEADRSAVRDRLDQDLAQRIREYQARRVTR